MSMMALKVLGMSLALVAIVAFYTTAGPLFHLHRVAVVGDDWVVSAQDVRAGLERSGKMSLIHGNFTALEETITALPLVRDAKVRKRLPHELDLEVQAREAIARSADGGLIDNNGEWYPADSESKLPIFAMERSLMPRAVDFYADASARFARHEVGINQVHHAEDGWRLFLSNGWILLLGERKIRGRLNRFLVALPDLRTRLDHSGTMRFDLRYPHGMALAGLQDKEIQQ